VPGVCQRSEQEARATQVAVQPVSAGDFKVQQFS
jgi:hypothetical protein